MKDIVRNALAEEARKLFEKHAQNIVAERSPATREKLAKAMALDYESPESLPLNFRIHRSKKLDGFTLSHITYDGGKGRTVTGNLYVPENLPPAAPAILNMHGHWKQGRLAARIQTRCMAFAKSGFVVLAVDAMGSGERASVHGKFDYHGGFRGGELWNCGLTPLGIEVADNMRGVDVLRSLPFVDSERIGATGGSGGGSQTMWLCAMDGRIAAAVPVVSTGTVESYVRGVNCICETLPGGAEIAEQATLFAQFAPRPTLFCNAMGDDNPTFYVSEMRRTFDVLKPLYKSLGAEENLAFFAFEGPHGYHPPAIRAAIGFFNKHLKGIGDGSPCDFPEITTLPEPELMIWKKGKRPAEFMTIRVLCAARKNSVPARTPEEIRALVTKKLAEGFARTQVIRKSRGGKGRTLIASEYGTKGLRTTKAYKEAAARGDEIVLLKLSGTFEQEGDTTPAAKAILGSYYNLSRACAWMGKPLVFVWASDYLSVARSFSDGKPLTLAGVGIAGAAAKFAGIAAEGAEEFCAIMSEDLERPPRATFARVIPGGIGLA